MQNESHRPNSAGRSLPLAEAVSLALAEAGPNLLKSPQNLWGYLGDVADRDAREVRALQRNCDESFVASLRPLVGSPSADEVRAATERAASCLESNGVAEDLAQSIAEKVVRGLLRGQGLEGLLGQAGGTVERQPAVVVDDRPPTKIADDPQRQRSWLPVLAVVLALAVAGGLFVLRPWVSEPPKPPEPPEKLLIDDTNEPDEPTDDESTADEPSVDEPSDDASSDDSYPQETSSVAGVTPRDDLADYSWDELEAIAGEISAASSDSAGLDIAKEYGLTDASGRLRGDEKSVTLEDGTRTRVRIVGFRHDKLASGGVAGITFEFADVPCVHAMNSDNTNEGGWKSSSMRTWLNDEFYGMLPYDLRSCVERAVKRTNNWGHLGGDLLSAVGETEDKIWLFSMSEVYGELSRQTDNVPQYATVYDAEGEQYQLYADQGVTTSHSGFCRKSGANSWWWLRSPNAGGSEGFSFHRVHDNGDWGYGGDYAAAEIGVSPGFCL